MDPSTAEISDVVAIPVEQASSWEEGYQGRVRATVLDDVECDRSQPCYFVIAHDGDMEHQVGLAVKKLGTIVATSPTAILRSRLLAWMSIYGSIR